MGGKLIRILIKELQAASVPLPITSHILCACSAGSDSMALAHLLIKYGRRVVAGDLIRLLHINHGWRGLQSDADAEFVRAYGAAMGVPVLIRTVPANEIPDGQSPECFARELRKAAFREAAGNGGWVFTAHHADDLAETVLWRIMTGSASTHGGGIAKRIDREVRPLLSVRKDDLKAFLQEEGLSWREDRTNFEGKLLRSQLRMELIPVLERLFPQAIPNLARLGLCAQASPPVEPEASQDGFVLAIRATGLPARRKHWEALQAFRERGNAWQGELHLEGGWTARRELISHSALPENRDSDKMERWVIERKCPSDNPSNQNKN